MYVSYHATVTNIVVDKKCIVLAFDQNFTIQQAFLINHNDSKFFMLVIANWN